MPQPGFEPTSVDMHLQEGTLDRQSYHNCGMIVRNKNDTEHVFLNLSKPNLTYEKYVEICYIQDPLSLAKFYACEPRKINETIHSIA